jgi:hypothetical protein
MSSNDKNDDLTEHDAEDDFEDNLNTVYDINAHEEMLQRYNLIVLGKQNLIVIQPFLRVQYSTNFSQNQTL